MTTTNGQLASQDQRPKHVVWDAEFRVVEWSGRAEKLFGWKAEEVKGRHPGEWNFLHEKGLAKAEQMFNRLGNGALARSIIKLQHYTKSGEVITCDWYNYTIPGSAPGSLRIESLVRQLKS